MSFKTVRIRVKELADALSAETDDVIAVCMLLDIPASSPLTSLSIEQCKEITDYYEESES